MSCINWHTCIFGKNNIGVVFFRWVMYQLGHLPMVLHLKFQGGEHFAFCLAASHNNLALTHLQLDCLSFFFSDAYYSPLI
jgi:hypothetical protein